MRRGLRRSLLLTILFSFSFQIASATPILGAIRYFSVFTFNNLSSHSDISGRVAVGGSLGANLTVNGLAIDRFEQFAYTTVVGGDARNRRIDQNIGGDVFARDGDAHKITIRNGTGNKITSGVSPIDFAQAEVETLVLSDYLSRVNASAPILGTTVSDDVVVSVSGVDNLGPNAEIFRLTADEFRRLDRIDTGGKTVVIDVVGTSPASPPAAFLVDGQEASAGSYAASRVLFNFRSATSLRFDGSMYGTILAPAATLTGSGEMNGQVVVRNYAFRGVMHGTPFAGYLPVTTPEPGTVGISLLGVVLIAFGRGASVRTKPGVRTASASEWKP